jgi:hypothetical protein
MRVEERRGEGGEEEGVLHDHLAPQEKIPNDEIAIRSCEDKEAFRVD